jgi:hypothetical protein
MRKQQWRETDRVWLGEWRCLFSVLQVERTDVVSTQPCLLHHSTPPRPSVVAEANESLGEVALLVQPRAVRHEGSPR